MGRKLGELRKPSYRRYKCLLTAVYAKYFGFVGRTSLAKNLLWERTNQIPEEEEIRKKHWKWIGHTLRKAHNCVTRQALIRNPQGQRRKDQRTHYAEKRRPMEMRRMNNNWTKLEMKAQDRMG
ncbi:unnamed protein product [Schistosoma margrebowiei]|uniref:Uncharacterized protein n=1 Tax=Schistosoma margrebowiei TaxID=48269 RepID=A0A183LZB1_9TREM|nr:unnamed protein product [Schistosoma margrebowiei]